MCRGRLRRDFYALSGLFYVADTHFEMFYKSSQKSPKKVAALVSQDQFSLDRSIDLDSLAAYLRLKFPTREHTDRADLSDLIASLTDLGITTYAPLDALIECALPAVEEDEREDPPREPTGERTRYVDSGIVRAHYGYYLLRL